MASWCSLASKLYASLQIIPPIPALEIIATPERSGRCNSCRHRMQLLLHASSGQKLRISKLSSARPCRAPRVVGREVPRPSWRPQRPIPRGIDRPYRRRFGPIRRGFPDQRVWPPARRGRIAGSLSVRRRRDRQPPVLKEMGTMIRIRQLALLVALALTRS